MEKIKKPNFADAPQQFLAGLYIADSIRIPRTKVRNIVVCGMGGSGLAGYALDTMALTEKLPLDVRIWNAYGLPPFANKNSVVVCISYSGNTEETISSYETASRSGLNVIAITSGGRLKQLAKRGGKPILPIPVGYAPRDAFGFMFGALVSALSRIGVLKISRREISATGKINVLRTATMGKRIARHIDGKAPLIYTSREWYALGHIWKIAMNETAKIPAFSYTVPEINHNEMEGFAGIPSQLNKNFCAVFIGFHNDHPSIKKRIKLSRDVWRRMANIESIAINFPKKNFIPLFLEAMLTGFWASWFLAEFHGISPEETELIEKFKKQMTRR